MPDSEIHWIANEGVRISKICDAVISADVAPRFRDVWSDLIATFQEDFTMLPAMKAAGANPGGANVSIPAGATRGAVSIVVNGNATINFGVGAAPAEDGAQARAAAVAKPPKGAEEKALVFDPNYNTRAGYNEMFLPVRVPLPGVVAARANEILMDGNKPFLLKYYHYSLIMNRVRRLQMWSAVNVDYTASKRRKTRKEFGSETWTADPRIPGADQIEDQDLYDPATKFDRGHIVARDDTAWGDTAQEEIFANSDSYHWTNCTPQHQNFNRDVGQFKGLWGMLENHIRTQAKNVGFRMSIFGGPILDAANDITHNFGGGDMIVPVRFWKVLIVTEEAASNNPQLRAYGFVLDQRAAIEEFGLEKFSAGKFQTDQLRLSDITKACGVSFDQKLLDADAMAGAPDEAARIRINSLDDVRL